MGGPCQGPLPSCLVSQYTIEKYCFPSIYLHLLILCHLFAFSFLFYSSLHSPLSLFSLSLSFFSPLFFSCSLPLLLYLDHILSWLMEFRFFWFHRHRKLFGCLYVYVISPFLYSFWEKHTSEEKSDIDVLLGLVCLLYCSLIHPDSIELIAGFMILKITHTLLQFWDCYSCDFS